MSAHKIAHLGPQDQVEPADMVTQHFISGKPHRMFAEKQARSARGQSPPARDITPFGRLK
jgi:hypothetical protein